MHVITTARFLNIRTVTMKENCLAQHIKFLSGLKKLFCKHDMHACMFKLGRGADYLSPSLQFNMHMSYYFNIMP